MMMLGMMIESHAPSVTGTEYSAGSTTVMPHIIRVPFRGSDITRSDLIARWIEFWCQQNCNSDWHLREYHTHVEVGFEDMNEMILFRLSPEFDLS